MIEEFMMGVMQLCAAIACFGCALVLYYVIQEGVHIFKRAKEQRKTYMPAPNLKDCERRYT